MGLLGRERKRRRKNLCALVSPADSEHVGCSVLRRGNRDTWQNTDLKKYGLMKIKQLEKSLAKFW